MSDNRLSNTESQEQLNLSLQPRSAVHCGVKSLWVYSYVCVCIFGSKSKGIVGTCPLVSFFTVAMWLDDTQTMHFYCACCVHAGQQGAAWQCLTLRRLRTGDRPRSQWAVMCVWFRKEIVVITEGLKKWGCRKCQDTQISWSDETDVFDKVLLRGQLGYWLFVDSHWIIKSIQWLCFLQVNCLHYDHQGRYITSQHNISLICLLEDEKWKSALLKSTVAGEGWTSVLLLPLLKCILYEPVCVCVKSTSVNKKRHKQQNLATHCKHLKINLGLKKINENPVLTHSALGFLSFFWHQKFK